jgi:hypothetical protein
MEPLMAIVPRVAVSLRGKKKKRIMHCHVQEFPQFFSVEIMKQVKRSTCFGFKYNPVNFMISE